MNYEIILTKKFDKNFSKLDKEIQLRVIKKLKMLGEKPGAGKPLKGKFKNLLSLRIGDYRIIYTLNEKRKKILIITIEHRKSVYK